MKILCDRMLLGRRSAWLAACAFKTLVHIVPPVFSLFHFYLVLQVLVRLFNYSLGPANSVHRRDACMFGAYMQIKRRSARIVLAAATERLGFPDDRRVCSFGKFLDLCLNSVDIDLRTLDIGLVGDMGKEQIGVYLQI